MRYCNNCHRITLGEPLFCNFCGRSYDVKLCPARHINPRSAVICSQCGSHDLSTPHPRMSILKNVLLRSIRIVPGILLLVFSILFLVEFVRSFLQNPVIQAQTLCAGLMLALLWWAYMQLPAFIRNGLKAFVRRKRSKDRGHH